MKFLPVTERLKKDINPVAVHLIFPSSASLTTKNDFVTGENEIKLPPIDKTSIRLKCT